MPFDPTTAKPLDQPAFDPASAKPVDESGSSFWDKLKQIPGGLLEDVVSAPIQLDPIASAVGGADALYQAATGSPIPEAITSHIPGYSASNLLRKVYDPNKEIPANTPAERAIRQGAQFAGYGLAGGEGLIPKVLSAGVGALSGVAGSEASELVPERFKPLTNMAVSGLSGLAGAAAVHPLMPKPPIETLSDIASGEAPPNTREPSYGPKPPQAEPTVTTPPPPPSSSEVVPKVKPTEANPFDEFDATTAKPVEESAPNQIVPSVGDIKPIEENPTELSRSGGEGIAKLVEPKAEEPVTPKEEFTPPEPTAENSAPMFDWIRGQEDELYRLSGENEADRTEGLKYVDALPDPIKDHILQEKLYHRAEDPSYPIAPEEEAVYNRYLAPIRDEATALINRIRGAGYNINSDGYIHRIVQGKGSMYDPAEGPMQTDAFGPKSLGRKTPSMMNRTMFKAVRDDGTGEVVNGNYKPEDEYKFPDGTTGKIRQATTREIEEATPLRYYKNAIANSLDNLLRLRRVERNINYLDGLKDKLQKNGLAYPPQAKGRIGDNGGPPMEDIPKDFRTVDLPQLAGWRMHPRIAKMLDNFYGKERTNALSRILEPINNVLTKYIFLNPLASLFGHGANVAAHWFVGRGLDNFMPHTWARSSVNMVRAWDDVKNLSPLYQKVQREGGALLYAPTLNRDFHKSMIKLMGSDVEKHPETWGEIARVAGTTPGKIVDALSNLSSQGLWFANDIFVMGRVRDLLDKGYSQRKAIEEVSHEIPTYRIPTEAWNGPGGTAFADVMRDKNIFIFSRYRYGLLHALANSVHRTVGKNVPLKERAEAVAQLLSLAALAFAYPIATNMVRKATGNDQAYLRKVGPMSAVEAGQAGYRMLTGENGENYEDKTLTDAMGGLFSLAPGTKAIAQLPANVDFFTKKPIYNPQGSAPEIAEQLGLYGAEQFSPVQQIESGIKGTKDLKSTVSSWFGVNLPTARQVRGRQFFQDKDNRDFEKAWRKKKRQLGIDNLDHIFGGH